MKYLSIIITFIFSFFFSILIFDLYVNGDQIAYTNFYNEIKNKSLFESYIMQGLMVSAAEPIFTLIYWLGSQSNIDKTLYISFYNGILAVLGYKLLRSYKLPIYTIVLILLGYYSFVLFFAAERLKFGIIFLLLAILQRRKKSKYFYYLLSILSHFSTILYFHLGLLNIFKFRLTTKIKKINILYFVIISILFIYLFNLFPIFNKFLQSEEKFRIANFIPSLIILADLYRLSWNNNSKRSMIFLKLFPVIITISILGSTRVNMLIYFIYVYEILNLRKASSIIFQISLFYNLIKSVTFIMNIIKYGEGFNIN